MNHLLPEDFSSITTITFDAGGTLLHPWPSVGHVYAQVASRHGLAYEEQALEAAFALAFAHVSKNESIPDPEEMEKSFWREIVRCTMDGLDKPQDFEAFFEDVWHTFARATAWRLYPGCQELLHSLRQRGYRLAVLSNWDRRLHQVLRGSGIAACFDAIFISSEMGAEKPDPAIFYRTAEILGVGNGEILHVGDSLKHDLEGCRRAGWNCYIVDHPGPGQIQMTPSYRNLLELLPERPRAPISTIEKNGT